MDTADEDVVPYKHGQELEPSPVTAAEGAKRRLTDLSADVLREVMCHFTRKRELRSLLLVCKHLYDLSVPELYRRLALTIDVTYEEHPRYVNYPLYQMLDPRNRGLSFVRELFLFDGPEHARSPKQIYEYPEIAAIVYTLPKNILTKFRWFSWHPLPSQIYKTLLSRQRSLTAIDLNYSDVSIDEMVGSGVSSLLTGFKVVEELRILPGFGEAMPQAACDLVRRHREIRTLILDLWHMEQLDHGEDHDIAAAYTSSGGMQALFKGLEPLSVCLHSLDLTGINLRGSHDDLISTLDLGALTYLGLFKCQHPEDFLKALNKAAETSPLHLDSFHIYHSRQWQPPEPAADAEDDTEPDRVLVEIEALLGTASNTFENIMICLRGFGKLPKTASIAQHGRTLRWLFLDVRKQKGPWALTYPLEDWQTLCGSLEKIQQLDAAYPPVVADCRTGKYSDFCDYVRATVAIPTLKTLGINTWPLAPGTSPHDHQRRLLVQNYRTYPHEAYYTLLATLAADIFKFRDTHLAQAPASSANKNMTAVTFGLAETLLWSRNWGYNLTPASFVKSVNHFMGGEKIERAEPMSVWAIGQHRPGDVKQFDIDSAAHDIGKFEYGWDDDDF
ncbi:MAG: hypothetical protein Q9201_004307 [Fulgogasparrea decipioides]